MSDDGNFGDGAYDPGDFLDRPDIHDYFDPGDDFEFYEQAWDAAPIDGFSEGQAEALAEMLVDWEGDIEDLLDYWEEYGFWEWWEENYGETT